MEISVALDYVRKNHRAVIQTYRRDGSPQLAPMAVDVDAEDKVIISCRETALKVGHLRRDPRVALCVLPDKWFGRWVQIEGTAEIISLPEAMPRLIDYYRSMQGEHPDWDDYRAAMVKDQRLIIRITVERAGPDRLG